MAIVRRPINRSFTTQAPIVYVSDGTSDYQVDARLYVQSIKQVAGKEGGAATLIVQLDDDFGVSEAIEQYAQSNKYVLVDTGENDSASLSVLFNGRIVRPSVSITGSGTETREQVILECEHLSQDMKHIWVFDRIVEQQQGNGQWCLIPVPTIFNYKGQNNRSGNTISRDLYDGTIDCPVFSSLHDGFDSEAKAWNYASIFLYLIGWYGSSEFTDFTDVDFSDFVSLCAQYANLDAGGSGLEYYLRQQAIEINIHGLSLLDAIDKVAKAAGIKYAYKNIASNNDNVIGVYVVFNAWATGSGQQKYLQLAKKETDIVNSGWSRANAQTILEENNIVNLQVAYDCSQLANYVIVKGAPYRYEFTAELVPGWPKDGILDNVSDVRTAKEATTKHWHLDGDDLENDSWYKNYHANSQLAGTKLQYGRYWVLNEDSNFSERDNFDIVSYLGLSEYQTQIAIWPRYFLPCLTCDKDGKSLGIVVEISFDSGSTWHVLNSGIRNLTNRCGIWLAIADISMLRPPGIEDPTQQNAWFALLEGTFKLRVTASVELDIRLSAYWYGNADRMRYLYIEDNNLKKWGRSPKSKYANSSYSSLPVMEFDDEAKAKNLAKAVFDANAQWQIPVRAIIPWLETEYEIGDGIIKVEGRDIPFTRSLGNIVSVPEVAAIIWRGENSYSTELILSDTRFASEVV